MAAALFNALVSPTMGRAVSAGTRPGDRVHPEVVTVMKGLGIDLSNVTPRLLTPELAAGVDVLVTMGCGEVCPVLPGVEREDWFVPDPKGESLERVHEIREYIREQVVGLIRGHGWDCK